MTIPPILPIPPIPGGGNILGMIIKGLKGLFGVFMNKFISDNDKISAEEPLNVEKSTVSEVSRINDVFIDWKNDIKTNAEDIEHEIQKICSEVFNSIVNTTLKQLANEKYNLNIKSLPKKFDRELQNIEGTIMLYLNKRISLDDLSCMEILKLPAGDLKKQRMSEFKKAVFREAMDMVINKIKNIEDAYFESIDSVQITKIQNIERQIEENTISYAALCNSKEEKNKEAEQIFMVYGYNIALCENIEQLLNSLEGR